MMARKVVIHCRDNTQVLFVLSVNQIYVRQKCKGHT